MKIPVPIRVSIDWTEELVDNDRSNFYMRLTPHAVIRKVDVNDEIAKKVGQQILENVSKGNKNIKVKK